ncbi:MAG: c-type cytochrome [Kofleriaceae bacterium]
MRLTPWFTRWSLPVLFGVAALGLRAVHAEDPPASGAAPAPSNGSIHGRVRFAGAPPVPAPLAVHHDTEVCAKGGPLVDESALVSADGGLANVVVVLQGAPAAPAKPAATAATLDQQGCRFVPHVRTVTLGTTLTISSSDPVLHNVHAFLGKRTAFNLAIPAAGRQVERKLSEPGILRIRCDSGHTWMSAYIAVVPHAYHAVSGADGTFQLPEVPPGEYRVRAWHERFGAVEQKVTVAAGQSPEISLTFKEPTDESGRPKPPDDQLRDALQATHSAIEELSTSRRAEERARLAREGAPLFQRYCATCHGQRGDGKGPSARFTSTPPRDFTRGTYKFRMSPAGSPPSHADLVRTISVGVRGTHMLGWKGKLSRSQIGTLARYLTTLSDTFWTDDPPVPPIEVPPETPYDNASVTRGRALYTKMQCGTCHGEGGEGNGPAAKTLRDDWGNRISPANLAHGDFKGGCCAAIVFRAISTGLGGTPMPSFAGAMTPDERWDLAHFIMSLGRHRPTIDYLLRDPAGRITTP